MDIGLRANATATEVTQLNAAGVRGCKRQRHKRIMIQLSKAYTVVAQGFQAFCLFANALHISAR
jgi:hypothetical protein